MEKYREKKSFLLAADQTIKPYTDNIFVELGTTLGMTNKAVHWAVSRHATDIFGDGNFVEIVETKNTVSKEEDVDYMLNKDGAIYVIINVRDPKELFYFDLVETVGPSRSYTSLRPGWTDTLFTIIARETGTSCVLNFKRANICGNEFTAVGSCKECQGTAKAESSNNRQTLRIELSKGTLPHTHTKHRRMTNAKSNFIASELEKKTVNQVYLKQAENIEMDAENLPRDFVNEKSIQYVRTKMNKQDDSAINMLRMLKYSDEYGDSIKEITTDPFGVIFWTKCQVYAYGQIVKQHGAAISLDATGGLIRTDSLYQDIAQQFERRLNLPHVFLYLISVKTPNGKSTPVGQMLSSQQDSLKISYFLERWANDFSVPREIAIDDSAALEKSCSRSFARCESTKSYVKSCFDLLLGNKCEPPKAFIRLDVAHYVKKLHQHKELKRMEPEIRHMYLAAFGFLMQCENFKDICSIVEHIITLANIPWFGDIDEQMLPTTRSQKVLADLVRSHDVRFMINEEEIHDNENDNDDECVSEPNEEESVKSHDGTDSISFFDEILSRVMQTSNDLNKQFKSKLNKNLNIYYNPKLNDFFKTQFNRLPLWTAAMKTYFRSPYVFGSSNDTESRFQAIKNVVFKDIRLPTRPDVFLRRILDVVDNISKLNRLEVQLSKNLLNVSNTDSKSSVQKLHATLHDLSLEVSSNENLLHFISV